MILDWKEYQEKVAEFFRRLGADANTNAKITGARSSHNVDVLITFTIWGRRIVWIIECKFWKSSVSKEKVLALQQIVQDVGADRGLLFSEKGFQSGAVTASNHTNITLTSLEDSQENAKVRMDESFFIQQSRRISVLRKEVKDIWLDDLGNASFLPGVKFDEAVLVDGTLMHLSHSLHEILIEEFPFIFTSITGERIVCTDQDLLAGAIPLELDKIESRIKELAVPAQAAKSKINEARKLFAKAVQELLIQGTTTISTIDKIELDKRQRITARHMNKVGKAADLLESIARGSIRRELSVIMRLLIDTIYLYLTQPFIDRTQWNLAIKEVLRSLKILEDIPRV